GRFVSSGAGANFKDDVFLVVGIFGQQKDLEFLLGLKNAAFETVEFLLRIRAHVRIFLVGEDGFAVGNSLLEILIFAVFLDYGRDLAVRLGGLLVAVGVANDVGRGKRLRKFLVTGFNLIESFKHDGLSFVGNRKKWCATKAKHGEQSRDS